MDGSAPADRTEAVVLRDPAWHEAASADCASDERFVSREIAGLRVVECRVEPHQQDRLQQLVCEERLACIGVQITKSGCESFRCGEDRCFVGPKDLVIWTSQAPIELTSTERLHKVSLVVPWVELKERLPRIGGFRGAVLDSRSGLGAVLYSHVDTLARQADWLEGSDLSAVRRATVELLAAAMLYRISTTPQLGLSHQYLIRLQNYILDHLQEEGLGPASIAQAHNMSPRYLHLLFSQTGQSVSCYIRQQRLDRCREALANPAYRARSVAEIAHQWGFPAPAHFSRIFKQHFGLSPNELRGGSR
ncbi:helix-turn-helix domain-containing protein [Methylibium sp.]|uniref:helix-turn-helix domain-containing protein n=1 Tax=Methylibium sp. TaxID=2067992 RepID=UPI003D0A3586